MGITLLDFLIWRVNYRSGHKNSTLFFTVQTGVVLQKQTEEIQYENSLLD